MDEDFTKDILIKYLIFMHICVFYLIHIDNKGTLIKYLDEGYNILKYDEPD